MNDPITYQTGAASLFATAARAAEPAPTHSTCPTCLSDDTKPIEEDGITYVCTNCGDVFNRAD